MERLSRSEERPRTADGLPCDAEAKRDDKAVNLGLAIRMIIEGSAQLTEESLKSLERELEELRTMGDGPEIGQISADLDRLRAALASKES